MGSFKNSFNTCLTNSTMKRFLALSTALLSLVSVSVGGKPGNLGEVLKSLGATEMLKLIDLADIAGPLSDTSAKYTVFAPTNKAFAKLPKSLVDQLTSDVELLKKVLFYHGVPGEVKSTDLTNDATVATLAGDKIRINIYPGAITVNGKRVFKPDIMASNGVIHLVSDVIYPIPTQNIAEIATGDERFSTLLAAVSAADLAGTLSGEGPFTVFAPTNDAFAKILAEKEALTKVLLRHVVPGTVFTKGVCSKERTT